MADPIAKIRHDYKASKSSGKRSTASIRYIVIHDAEVDDATKGAEKVGSYFASAAAKGSTQYGADNDSTQQYASDSTICWGAPPINTTGLHIELMGKSSHSRERWLLEHRPSFQRAGWLIAKKCRAYKIPINLLTTGELKTRGVDPGKGKGGIVSHRSVSAAFHKSTHTDPGTEFPFDVVLAWARHYTTPAAKIPVAKHRVRPVLHLGSEGPWVKRVQKKLGVAQDGKFGAITQEAVKRFQRAHHLHDDGVVGPLTWKALGV